MPYNLPPTYLNLNLYKFETQAFILQNYTYPNRDSNSTRLYPSLYMCRPQFLFKRKYLPSPVLSSKLPFVFSMQSSHSLCPTTLPSIQSINQPWSISPTSHTLHQFPLCASSPVLSNLRLVTPLPSRVSARPNPLFLLALAGRPCHSVVS